MLLRNSAAEESGFSTSSVGVDVPHLESIVEDWSDLEEQALCNSHLRYSEISKDIAGCLAALDGEALQEPFEAARRDPDYAAALLAVQDTLRELDAPLAGSYSQ